MIKKSLFFISLLFVTGHSWAQLSAHRQLSRPFEEYTQRIPFRSTSVYGLAKPYNETEFIQNLKQNDMQIVPLTEFKALFSEIRDLRYLQDKSHASWLRRITWLYPDDGCFVRASLVSEQLINQKVTGIKKIFVFGNLHVSTSNSNVGAVGWWYHVAVIMAVEDSFLVFDPSIDPKAGMSLSAWFAAMHVSYNNTKLALCSPTAFDPNSDCDSKEEISQSKLDKWLDYFLDEEWERMIDLGRDPKKVLGDSPPWLMTLP